jgi:carboxymethylenebutenolidase
MLRDYLAGEVAEDYSDGLLSRREALRRLGLLGLGAAAATGVLAACGTPDAPAPGPARPAGPVPGRGPDTPTGADVTFPGPDGPVLRGAWAAPAGAPKGSVLVLHENKGLTPHFYDLVGRFAGAGYGALCVDLLSAQGGTAAITDPAQPPAILSAAPRDAVLGDLGAGIEELIRRQPNAKIGVVGFCFGGAMVWNLLDVGEDRLAAAVPFYGPAPENPDFRKAKAAVAAVYAEQDARVNASKDRAEAALRAAGLEHTVTVYPGVDHAFFNDTGPRYNPAAAGQAWQATLDWLGRHVATT